MMRNRISRNSHKGPRELFQAKRHGLWLSAPLQRGVRGIPAFLGTEMARCGSFQPALGSGKKLNLENSQTVSQGNTSPYVRCAQLGGSGFPV